MMLKYLSSKPYKSLCYGLGVSASVFMLSACGGSGSSGSNVPAGPIISVSEASVVEGVLDSTTPVTFTLTLAEAADQATSVDYITQDGTATSGEDYTAIAGTLNFTAGETSATVTVDIVGDDTFEVDEYFALVLSNAQGLELNESSIGKGTIETDEDADSKGYFFGSATITIKSTEESTEESTVVSDLIGLAYENRLMLFSKTGTPNVLYDIKGMDVEGTRYNATADVYVNGEIAFSTISVSGETTEASITGTMTGLDFANASFEIEFIDASNQRTAAMDRLIISPSSWLGMGYGMQVDETSFAINKDTMQNAFFDQDTLNNIDCDFFNTIEVSGSAIYNLISTIEADESCDYSNKEYDGFAAVINGEQEDQIFVHAFSNGEHSQFGVIEKYTPTE